MIVTLEVGPRIIRLGFVDGPNIFRVNQAEVGKTGGPYRSYGGHRLWIAPEEAERTLQPDNDPVEYVQEGATHVFTTPADTYHMRKQIRITPDEAKGGFVLEHRVYNDNPYAVEFAAWCLSQCVGGTVLFPQAPFESHADRLLPTRPLVMWGYTKLSDPRWTWGDRIVRLRYDASMPSQKIGTFVEQGYAACAVEGALFLKRWDVHPGVEHCDLGSNFETFTNEHILEIESLGPKEKVAPGAYASHTETWYLLPNQTPPEDDAACADWLTHLAAKHPEADAPR